MRGKFRQQIRTDPNDLTCQLMSATTEKTFRYFHTQTLKLSKWNSRAVTLSKDSAADVIKKFQSRPITLLWIKAWCKSHELKSSNKVGWMGALNFYLHAVGSFIHLRHVGTGLQNFIHLRHLAALAGYVHSSKN